MKLMVITNNPGRASFRQRVGVYLDILRDNGIDCKCIVYPRVNLARWKLLRRCSDFDAVFLHKKTLNIFDAFLLRRYAQKVIFNFDDAVMYDDKHPEQKPSRRKHTKPFERTTKLADMVIAGNTYLAEHAKEFNANVKILPTGLCLDEYHFSTKQKKNDKVRLVWIGSKSTLSYLASIKPALDQIGSLFDNVVLRIICDEFFDLRNMKVEKRQWSLQSQAGDLATSDIGLAPLPDNRFTRGKCGFKILQYAAVSLPVVASPVGTNSEYVRDSVTGFHASQIQEWVEKITKLIENPELRRRMGQAGRESVQRFDLKVVGKELVDVIKGCLKNATS